MLLVSNRDDCTYLVAKLDDNELEALNYHIVIDICDQFHGFDDCGPFFHVIGPGYLFYTIENGGDTVFSIKIFRILNDDGFCLANIIEGVQSEPFAVISYSQYITRDGSNYNLHQKLEIGENISQIECIRGMYHVRTMNTTALYFRDDNGTLYAFNTSELKLTSIGIEVSDDSCVLGVGKHCELITLYDLIICDSGIYSYSNILTKLTDQSVPKRYFSRWAYFVDECIVISTHSCYFILKNGLLNKSGEKQGIIPHCIYHGYEDREDESKIIVEILEDSYFYCYISVEKIPSTTETIGTEFEFDNDYFLDHEFIFKGKNNDSICTFNFFDRKLNLFATDKDKWMLPILTPFWDSYFLSAYERVAGFKRVLDNGVVQQWIITNKAYSEEVFIVVFENEIRIRVIPIVVENMFGDDCTYLTFKVFEKDTVFFSSVEGFYIIHDALTSPNVKYHNPVNAECSGAVVFDSLIQKILFSANRQRDDAWFLIVYDLETRQYFHSNEDEETNMKRYCPLFGSSFDSVVVVPDYDGDVPSYICSVYVDNGVVKYKQLANFHIYFQTFQQLTTNSFLLIQIDLKNEVFIEYTVCLEFNTDCDSFECQINNVSKSFSTVFSECDTVINHMIMWSRDESNLFLLNDSQ
ncbi:hypothetical protein PCE1_000816 [Barthelona sp. PCE]